MRATLLLFGAAFLTFLMHSPASALQDPSSDSSADLPRIENRTKSLEVVSYKKRPDEHLLLLRNISSKNISAIRVYMPTKAPPGILDQSGLMLTALGGTLIAPGGSIEALIIYCGQ